MTSGTTRQRVAIIGCGYVGTALGRALADDGHDVVGTTTTPARAEDLRAEGIRPIVLEMADTDGMRELLQDRDAAVMCVAAGRKRSSYRQVYLEGAVHLLSAAKGTPIRRIIYTSSTRVYGQDDGSWVNESSPTQPADENGRILLETEQALLHIGAPADRLGGNSIEAYTTVLRLGGIWGYGRDLVSRIRTLAGSRRDDGDGFVNLIHRDDVVAATGALLLANHDGVLNLCDNKPTTRREFYDRILCEERLPPIEWITPSSPPRLGKRVSNRRIIETLGLKLAFPTH